MGPNFGNVRIMHVDCRGQENKIRYCFYLYDYWGWKFVKKKHNPKFHIPLSLLYLSILFSICIYLSIYCRYTLNWGRTQYFGKEFIREGDIKLMLIEQFHIQNTVRYNIHKSNSPSPAKFSPFFEFEPPYHHS